MLDRAARMRREATEPEKRLWMALRDNRLAGYKFRRQAMIDNRIADFFCPAKGLIVELDGNPDDREKDVRMDRVIEQDRGFMTIRFTNEDVMRNLDGVLLSLHEELRSRSDRWPGRRSTTPQPPPLKRRGRASQ